MFSCGRTPLGIGELGGKTHFDDKDRFLLIFLYLARQGVAKFILASKSFFVGTTL